MKKISFNYPHSTGREIATIRDAMRRGHLAGNGYYTKKCQEWLEGEIGTKRALLTHSCTGALEMAALLTDVGAGDEIIMPSFTFVSTANAFVLRGATPVFVDIRKDTLNIDESLIESAISPRTKVIVVVHYAGVSCDMDAILSIARRYNLIVVEDAAQAINALYKGKPLGSFGHLAALSFHETKNVISGEGGALLINDERYMERAEIIWEKGTNRANFFRGMVDKYTWVDIGSSFLPSELIAAFLYPQLMDTKEICSKRIDVWKRYHDGLCTLRDAGIISGPVIPDDCSHNGHLYYLLAMSESDRDRVLRSLRAANIGAVHHYVPLHSSPAGKRFGKVRGPLPVTEDVNLRLIRLPLWPDIPRKDVRRICYELDKLLRTGYDSH